MFYTKADQIALAINEKDRSFFLLIYSFFFLLIFSYGETVKTQLCDRVKAKFVNKNFI